RRAGDCAGAIVRHVAPGQLAVSHGLQQADPAAIARWAAVIQRGAEQLNAAGDRLDGLHGTMGGRMWLSPAAAAFASADGEQVRRLRVVADLFAQLAAVAARLAPALAEAHE